MVVYIFHQQILYSLFPDLAPNQAYTKNLSLLNDSEMILYFGKSKVAFYFYDHYATEAPTGTARQ